MRFTRGAAVAVAALLPACRAPTSGAPLPPAVDWGWPAAAADAGATRFQLQAILRNAPWTPGGDETWQVQGEVETGEPGLLVSDLHAKVRVTPDDGVERAWDRERASVDARHRQFVAFGLDLGPGAKRIASLEIELRLVRVKTWRTASATVGEAGTTLRTPLAPFEFALVGEPAWVTVSAYSTDELVRSRRDAWDLLSHRWAAGAASVVDARGVALDPMGGGGSGGFTSCSYGSMSQLDSAVAYPVTATFRVPDTWDAETVRYRFTDLDLACVPPPR